MEDTVRQQEKKEGLVNSEIGNLDKATACLEEVISQLKGRLAVVSQEKPSVAEETEKDGMSIPLANQISGLRRRIQKATERLIIMKDNLEI